MQHSTRQIHFYFLGAKFQIQKFIERSTSFSKGKEAWKQTLNSGVINERSQQQNGKELVSTLWVKKNLGVQALEGTNEMVPSRLRGGAQLSIVASSTLWYSTDFGIWIATGQRRPGGVGLRWVAALNGRVGAALDEGERGGRAALDGCS
jgi:hypothetical protein